VASRGGSVPATSRKTAELTREDLVSMFKDEPKALRIESGQVLFKNGDPPGSMYIVRSGTVTIRSGSVKYEDVGPGGMVGEMGIVETYLPRSAMVYALTAAELVEIDRERFLSLVEETPSFALAVMRVLSRRLRRMDERYEDRTGDDIH
jgi:CRP/FNR family transcriptional regulator, cyclic AMP receptor protein